MNKETETGVSITLPTLLTFNKSQIRDKVNSIASSVSDGYADSVEALIIAKKGQEFFKQLEDKVRPIAESEARIGKGDILRKFDAEIIERESGVKYDFSVCGDNQWAELSSQVAELSEKLKERERFLKSITKPFTYTDEDTGDTFSINPPIRSGKSGLAVTLK